MTAAILSGLGEKEADLQVLALELLTLDCNANDSNKNCQQFVFNIVCDNFVVAQFEDEYRHDGNVCRTDVHQIFVIKDRQFVCYER